MYEKPNFFCHVLFESIGTHTYQLFVVLARGRAPFQRVASVGDGSRADGEVVPLRFGAVLQEFAVQIAVAGRLVVGHRLARH